MSDLTLSLANHIIEAALERSKELGYRPMAVVVVDDSGNIKSAQREDGASMFRVDVALGKAWGAVAFSTSSRELGERASENPNFFLSLPSTAGGKFCRNQEQFSSRTRVAPFLGRWVQAVVEVTKTRRSVSTESALPVSVTLTRDLAATDRSMN